MNKQEMLSLTRLKETLAYDERTGEFRWLKVARGRRVGSRAGHKTSRLGRIEIRVDGYLYYAHRLAWFYVYGRWPSGEIDHKNRDQSDNKISNLRIASRSDNCANTKTPTNNTSGKKGVHWHRGLRKWRARIKVRGSFISLGCYEDLGQAHAAYSAAAVKHFGDFAQTE